VFSSVSTLGIPFSILLPTFLDDFDGLYIICPIYSGYFFDLAAGLLCSITFLKLDSTYLYFSSSRGLETYVNVDLSVLGYLLLAKLHVVDKRGSK
jgi:hypothetical protein